MTSNYTVNGTELKARNRVTDIVAGTIVTIILTPALAAPVGLAWRVFHWAAGL